MIATTTTSAPLQPQPPAPTMTLAAVVMSLLLVGCSTLAEHPPDAGDRHTPNARLGPFRELLQSELGQSRLAPTVLSDDSALLRAATVLSAGDDAPPLASWAYAARIDPQGADAADPTVPTTQLVRIEARDGRSFSRRQTLVLSASLPWEAGVLAQPSALWVEGQVWLYYAAAGGIGLARGDGEVFTRYGAGPVLAPVAAGWEQGRVPHSPSVLRRGAGDWVMFYALSRDAAAGGAAIGEAVSEDGLRWTRVGAGPAWPQGGAAIDGGGADGPCVVSHQSPLGRRSEQLYYRAVDEAGVTRVALAARFEGERAFVGANAAMFVGDAKRVLSQPWVVRHDDFTLLFVTQREPLAALPTVVAGVAPAAVKLPPRSD